MAKINITKPTGNVESLELLTAFKAEDTTYIIFSSDKIGSMGLPIIYISKFNGGKLEKIIDANEWQNVKNYLKGIINGTNFQYIKVDNNMNADEAYYTPLTLPQASFDLISSRYVVKEDSSDSSDNSKKVEESEVQEETLDSLINTAVIPTINNNGEINNQSVQNTPTDNIPTNIESNEALVSEPIAMPQENKEPVNVASVAPVMPDNNVASNENVNMSPVNTVVTDNKPSEAAVETPVLTTNVDINLIENNFDKDKEMFLKACENMFDALISKYQKEFIELERKEQELKEKEKMIEEKMHNANEHLANAAAREQVANIAHDNAQRVMDLNNLMPQNPDNN